MRARRVAAAALLISASSLPASPTGTPPSNAPHSGKGTAIDLPFGRHHADAAGSAAGGDAASSAPRRHLSQAEWRKAFIARHGHDLQAPAHPGH